MQRHMQAAWQSTRTRTPTPANTPRRPRFRAGNEPCDSATCGANTACTSNATATGGYTCTCNAGLRVSAQGGSASTSDCDGAHTFGLADGQRTAALAGRRPSQPVAARQALAAGPGPPRAQRLRRIVEIARPPRPQRPAPTPRHRRRRPRPSAPPARSLHSGIRHLDMQALRPQHLVGWRQRNRPSPGLQRLPCRLDQHRRRDRLHHR